MLADWHRKKHAGIVRSHSTYYFLLTISTKLFIQDNRLTVLTRLSKYSSTFDTFDTSEPFDTFLIDVDKYLRVGLKYDCSSEKLPNFC
jgi:hypothetical protein